MQVVYNLTALQTKPYTQFGLNMIILMATQLKALYLVTRDITLKFYMKLNFFTSKPFRHYSLMNRH